MAGWIKMPLGMEVGLGPDHIVQDGDPAPPPKKKGGAPSNFWPVPIVAMAGWIKMPLGTEVPAPSPLNGMQPPSFWPMSIVAKRLDG